MKHLKKFNVCVVCALIIVMLTSCQTSSSSSQAPNSDDNDVPVKKTESSGVKSYKSCQEAYLEVMTDTKQKQESFSSAQDIGRACLFDIDGNGQDELICVYVGGTDTLYCAVWTFHDGKPVLLVDSELASMAEVGTGGINLVEYEGDRYICGWASNSESWESEANMYYNCFLWEYPAAGADFEYPFKYPTHTFAFRYYLMEGGDIRSDAFSFLLDDRIALSIENFKELKHIFLDSPVQALCEADIIHSSGLTFDEMLSLLQP